MLPRPFKAVLESSPLIRVQSTPSTLGAESWAESKYIGDEYESKSLSPSTSKTESWAESKYLSPSPSPSTISKQYNKQISQ